MKQRIVLDSSGGVDTAIAIPWLADLHDAEIVAVTLDLGQGRDLTEVRERVLAAGAIRCHVLDVRDEFVRECLLPSLRTPAPGDGRDPLRTALGRSFIVGKLVEIAEIEHAAAIAHGWRDEAAEAAAVSARAINPRLQVISLGELPEERPAVCGPVQRLGRPAHVEIAFDAGAPVAVNGVPMSLSEVIECLSTIAGDHGFACAGHAEAATLVLHAAHRELDTLAPATLSASVRLELFKGEIRIMAGDGDSVRA